MDMEDLTGKTLDQYQIVGPLGEGGMAAVYKAYQPGVDRYVAIKVLPRHFASDPQFVQRFQREAQIIARLQHPHILPVHDYGEAEGYTYIVMPFVETGTLADLFHGQPLSADQTRQIISQVGDALDCAHSEGVIHRDIKPSNILIDQRGNCLLTDFGIGKVLEGGTQITRTGDVIGTPAYMSPEQGLGSPIDARSDIYSLGVMLYEMVAGRQPYDAETPMAIVIKHIYDPLPLPRSVNPSIPEVLERVILKALAKDPDDRFGTAGELVTALQEALDHEPVSEPAPAPTVKAAPVSQRPAASIAPPRQRSLPPKRVTTRQPEPRRRPRLAWILAGIGVLGLLGVAVVVGLYSFAKQYLDLPPVSEAARSLVDDTQVPQDEPAPNRAELPTVYPDLAAYVYDAEGLALISPAVIWGDISGFEDVFQADILEGPQGEFERVARLYVRGYGHGDQAAWFTIDLDVPEDADIVSIPVATALNGPVDETDSEAGLEIVVGSPNSLLESWTYASYLFETQLGIPYVYAFADVSPFRGRQASLTITLRQTDVCAGAQCTHDADFYIGDLYYGRLPDICTTLADGSLQLYDYYSDPTPQTVTECADPKPYYFQDVEYGPFNTYGAGEDEYQIPFSLPEGASLVEFRLYYGYYARSMTINNHTLATEDVHAAFPQRSGTYLNIPKPSRYSLFNNNPEAVAAYFNSGRNDLSIVLYAQESWEERPFDLFMRFQVPTP